MAIPDELGSPAVRRRGSSQDSFGDVYDGLRLRTFFKHCLPPFSDSDFPTSDSRF
ncbi:hypothetical protein [Nostoc sp.]|uniref:hypothetical protein n=1 Tax=Nostoc sp. TaxID=1180 RepID=UPI002FF82FA3